MYDVVALGELLIDFTPYGKSNQNNDVLEVIQVGHHVMFYLC